MSRITLSKTALNEARQALKRYRQCVPALEMKRQQLMQQQAELTQQKAAKSNALEELDDWVSEHLPNQSWSQVDLAGLINECQVSIEHPSVLGVTMPVIQSIHLAPVVLEKLGSPVWLDALQQSVIQGVTLIIEMRVLDQQISCVAQALKTTSQRLNLFEKIRIPETVTRIRKIEIALSDQERAAVVIAKIAKQKQQKTHAKSLWGAI